MASMTVSGIVSGIDWESMISQMIESAQKPALVQVTKRTNLTNKKALFEEMQELTQTLQSSITSLRLTSTYRAKTFEAERVDKTGSYKGVLTAKVNADAEVGVYNINVKQLATAATRRSDQLSDGGNSTLKEYADTMLWFTQNGQKTGVTISANETLSSLASKINNQVKTLGNPMGFTASVVDNRLILKSDESGEGWMRYDSSAGSSPDVITYSSSGNTKLPIDIDVSNLGENDFTLTGTKSDGTKTTYTLGEDFDIVNGNEIRWRTKDANTVKVGDTYTIKYKAAVGDTYTSPAVTRGSGSVDADALTFTPSSGTDGTRFTVTDSEGFTYTYGTDFTFNGRSIKWLNSGDAPDEGSTYTVNYIAGGSPIQTQTRVDASTSDRIDYYQRTGTLNVIYGTDANGDTLTWAKVKTDINNGIPVFSVVDENGKSYKFGTDFTIEQNGPSGTLPRIVWTSTGSKPDSTTKFYVSYVPSGNESFELEFTRGDTDTVTSGTKTSNTFTTNGAVITTSDGATYTEGRHFTVEQTTSSSGAKGPMTIKWINEDDAPDAGQRYTIALTTTDTTPSTVYLDGVKAAGGVNDSLTEKMTLTDDTTGTEYYEGVDYELVADSNGDISGIKWLSNATWTIPGSGAYQGTASSFTLNRTFSDGSTQTLTGTRTKTESSVSLSTFGFSEARGSTAGVKYGDQDVDGYTNAWFTFGIRPNMSSSTSVKSIIVNWDDSAQSGTRTYSSTTDHTNLPDEGESLAFTYRYSTTSFEIDDAGSTLLQALGLKDADGNVVTDEEHYTAAQDALIEIDGDEYHLAGNEIDYDDEPLNGVKLELKGTGQVLLDITQDTDKAVETVQTFVDAYNTLMDWINTRSTEKQVNSLSSDSDTTTTLTRSSDEFNTSWGLLYGNSYLRTTKSSLRSIISQNYTFSFSSRSSLEPVYGTMGYNGLRNNTTLTVQVGDRYANITIEPGDTLDSIAKKINNTDTDPFKNEAWALHYNEEDRDLSASELAKKQQGYITAKVVNDKLVIAAGSTAETNREEVTLSGSTALNLLNLNYTYKGLYQVGIETTSDNYGISGEIDFSAEEFRSALEDDPEEVEGLMIAFAKQMDAQMKSMLSATSTSAGTLKREISNLETQITSIDEYLEKYQKRLDNMEERLRSQYAAAEERISELSQQASSLSSILSQLGSYSSSSSS